MLRSALPLALALCLAAPLAAQDPAKPEVSPEPETTGEPATPPASTQPDQPAAPPEDLLDFSFTFPEEEGGGTAAGTARNLEYQREDYAVLLGAVKIKYQDIELSADRAELDIDKKVVIATGNVIVDQGPRRLTGETATFDLETKTGTLTEATAHVASEYYFSGAEVAKVGEDVYTVTDGVFTSCAGERPDWSFRLGQARVEMEGYARVRNAAVRVKRVPVLYTPYLLWPAKSERSSGLLIPNIGYSERRGAALSLAYFQTLGRSVDTTMHVDTYSLGFLGLGNELRYQPSEGTRGSFVGYAVSDPDRDEWRWKINLDHVTDDLPWGMRGVVAYEDFSDFEFFRDFERDLDRNTTRRVASRAFVSRNRGAHLLNFLLNEIQTLDQPGVTVVQRKLPELEYRLRSTRLWRTPFYVGFRGSLDYLDLDNQRDLDATYGRVDLGPELSLPVSTLPWLSLNLTGGGRYTWYGDSLAPAGDAFSGESLTRSFPFGRAELVGPSLSRIYERPLGAYSRFKHVLSPRVSYTYSGEVEEEQPLVPRFDEVDTAFSTNRARFALVNRILGKPEEGKGAAREVFLFELSRDLSFDDEQPLQSSFDGLETDTAGPLESLLRINPSERTSLESRLAYDTLAGRLSSSSLTGGYGWGVGNSLGLTLYRRPRPEAPQDLGTQVQFFGALGLLPNRLRLEGRLAYDIDEAEIQQQRYVVNWLSQCYGFRLELLSFQAQAVRNREYRFSLTLKNVGTFLDLTGRSSVPSEQ
ncbi:MAG TPA: LPS assembly protein LptD [Thermoanaerobaculia bacterium]|nr:LPS assembly protein LptD [Thermoanaerobaculia bacterium]